MWSCLALAPGYTLVRHIPNGACAGREAHLVFRELAKAVALILTIVSLYALLGSAFFAPGSPWQQRLLNSIETLAMSACVCFASGLLFSIPEAPGPTPYQILTRTLPRTLPVQLFFWSLGAMVLLFLLSRYVEVFYVPFIWKNQPY
jgi:hypothetical protein